MSVLNDVPAALGERELRADGDAVEAREGAVAVVADREAPAALADLLAQVAAVAADRDGGEPDLRDGAARALEAVERVDALARRASRRRRAPPGRARRAGRR